MPKFLPSALSPPGPPSGLTRPPPPPCWERGTSGSSHARVAAATDPAPERRGQRLRGVIIQIWASKGVSEAEYGQEAWPREGMAERGAGYKQEVAAEGACLQARLPGD